MNIRAFGDLQRKAWQEKAPESNRTWALLAAIVKARAERIPSDPAEVEARRITLPEYDPNPVAPAYRWCNATQCYVLHHSPEM